MCRLIDRLTKQLRLKDFHTFIIAHTPARSPGAYVHTSNRNCRCSCCCDCCLRNGINRQLTHTSVCPLTC